MNTSIGDRISSLIDYLNLTYNEFIKECDISDHRLIKRIVMGATKTPSISTLNKILKRYPVNRDWLYFGIGEMWEEDYFENRFKAMHKKYKTASQKINGMSEIFEVTLNAFSRKVKINRSVLFNIKNEHTKSISEMVSEKIINTYSFIPKDYFND